MPRHVTALCVIVAIMLVSAGCDRETQQPPVEPGPALVPKATPGQLQAADATSNTGDDPLPAGAIRRMGTLRMWHETAVSSVTFSPDDEAVATADRNGTVRVWDVNTGRLRLQLPPKTGREVAYSPDGRLLATGGYYQNRIHLWDAETGREVRSLEQNARSLAFSRDGKYLVGAGRDAIVRLWDPATGELVRQFKGHHGGLYAVAISPDGKTIASGGGGDGTAPGSNEVRLWNTDTGEEIGQLLEDNGDLEGTKGWIYAIEFSPDGETLAVASPYAVRVYDLKRQKQFRKFEKCSYDVAFSPQAGYLALPGEFGVYDPSTGEQVVTLPEDVGVDGCVAYSSDGRMIASGNRQGRVQLWNAQTGTEIVVRNGHHLGVTGMAFSSDGSAIASVSRGDGTIRVWDPATGQQRHKFKVVWKGSDVWWNAEGTGVFFLPHGRTVGTWLFDGTVDLRRLDRQRRYDMKLPVRSMTGMVLAEGTTIAAIHYTGHSPGYVIDLFAFDGATKLKTLKPFGDRSGADARISCLAFSPDRTQLAIGLTDRRHHHSRQGPLPETVQIWDLARGELVGSFRPNENAPGRIAFSPDGALLVTAATGDTAVQLWHIAEGMEVRRFAEEDVGRSWYESSPVTFSPDGRLLATANQEDRIVIWDVATGEKTLTLSGHAAEVTSLVFSPDGKSLLSGSRDTTLLLWDLANAVEDD